MQTLAFSHGDKMPVLGLGTWKSSPGEVYTAVREAIRMGYRHIDCAAIYGNEAEIGAALADCFADQLVRREELWITSKLWNDCHQREDVGPALDRTLRALRLEYLDLYLVHWPVALRKGLYFPSSGQDFLSLAEVPIAETWAGMEAALESGRCRHIGVSNFNLARLSALIETARRKPEANQIELHPYLQQRELVAFCQKHGVVVTAYSPLGSGDRPAMLKSPDEPVLLDDPVVRAIAARHNATPAQVLIAWAIGRGLSVIPKSVRPERLRQNLAAAELSLTGEDMQQLLGLERGYRFIAGSIWAMDGSPYTLADLWGETSAL